MQCPFRDPKKLSMPPPLAPQFFIGRESLKDAWVNQLRAREKILVTNIVKKEFKEIESHDGKGLYLTVGWDTQSVKKRYLGVWGIIFLDFCFKDVFRLVETTISFYLIRHPTDFVLFLYQS